MPFYISLRNSNISGSAPSLKSLSKGELAINTYDGRIFLKKIRGKTESLVTIGGIDNLDGTKNYLLYTNDSGSISSSIAYQSGSNIGLNKTSSLNGALDVIGNVTITGSLNITGSITSTGTITAQTLIVQIITSSISYITGSTRFGSLISDTHTFTGSLSISGSITGSRINPRTVTTASTAILTPDINAGDTFTVTAQTSSLTLANPIGNPVEGQKIIIRIKDNGTARALSTGSQYRASTDLSFPLSSSVSKTLYLGLMYNSTDTKWDLLAVLNNF